MDQILAFLPTTFGTVLHWINGVVGNYGVAIILFTILIRLIIFPLTIKQLQSSAKMQDLQPKLAEIQERYKNDKEKLGQEQMKLYKDEGVNPFGGCLPLLIQLPILFSMLYAFSQPLTYQLGQIGREVLKTPEYIKFATDNKTYPELLYVSNLNPSVNPSGQHLNMNFGPFDLSRVPVLDVSTPQNIWLLLLVIVATACTFLSIKISMKRPNQPVPAKADAAAKTAGMNKMMMFMLPAMTLFFSFSFPAGLTLYWTTGYIIQIFQQLAINKWFHGRKKEVVDPNGK